MAKKSASREMVPPALAAQFAQSYTQFLIRQAEKRQAIQVGVTVTRLFAPSSAGIVRDRKDDGPVSTAMVDWGNGPVLELLSLLELPHD